MVDFAGYLWIVIALGVALLNVAMIPIRYGQLQSTAADTVHRMAMKKTMSAAIKEFSSDSNIPPVLAALQGVHIKRARLNLVIASAQGDEVVPLDSGDAIPTEWLPNGPHSPCEYQLNLHIEAEIDPLLTASIAGQRLSGLNAPVSMTVDESSHWENLAMDPLTKRFYLNE